MNRLLVSNDEELRLDCGLGWYFDFIDTCQSLEYELLIKWSWCESEPQNTDEFIKFERSLKLRQGLHSKVQNPVVDGSFRSPALTVMTLIAFEYDSGYRFFVKRRSNSVAIYPGIKHVMPSGTCQPTSDDVVDEWQHRDGGPLATFHREYLEELFNMKETQHEQADWRYFYGDQRFKYLQQLIEQEQAEFLFTGVAVNLLNLQPEICTLLIMKTPEWFIYHSQNPIDDMRFQFNEEWETDRQRIQDSQELPVSKIPYSDNDEDMLEHGAIQASKIVPTGAAAFWMGVDVFRKITF